MKPVMNGIAPNESSIIETTDEATGIADRVLTRGNILTIYGTGLKIEADEKNMGKAGVYFTPDNGEPVKASIVELNNPKTLVVHIPYDLVAGEKYSVSVHTQSSEKKGILQKNLRNFSAASKFIAA